MRILGDVMLALGLLATGLAAGFVVSLVATISINAIVGPPPVGAEPSGREVVESLVGYVAMGLTAAVVFVTGWRALRAS